jgi:hypothetical protein
MRVCNDFGSQPGITSDGRWMGLNYKRDLRLAECADKQWAFNCHEDAVTPTGAGSVFAVVMNLGPELLVVDRIKLTVAGAHLHNVQKVAAFTMAGGAALTAVNRCMGSSNLFASKGSFYGGAAVTGQGTATTIHEFTTVSGVDKVLDLSKCPIVLSPNWGLQIASATGAVSLTYTINCWFACVPRTNG